MSQLLSAPHYGDKATPGMGKRLTSITESSYDEGNETPATSSTGEWKAVHSVMSKNIRSGSSEYLHEAICEQGSKLDTTAAHNSYT